jgi:hypothetical protein
MWRFRISRPVLLLLGVADALLMVFLWIMESFGATLGDWTVTVIGITVFANFLAIWWDGVS